VPATIPLPQLDTIRIASPCTADWASMTGDERVRHCGQCDRKVYDLSEMTRQQAEALVFQAEGRLCARFYRRADGTILTADCPVGLARARARVASWAARGAAALAAMITLAAAASPSRRGIALRDCEPFAWIGSLLGRFPPKQRMQLDMGEIVLREWPDPPPTPPH
jgi:hypothetical protein